MVINPPRRQLSEIINALYFLALLLLLSTAVVGRAAAESAVGASNSGPKIALLLPLSGPLADWGNAMRLGAEMAIAESGVPGRLLVEDTQFQSSVTLSVYEKLVHADRPDAVIVFGSSVSIALAPRVERDRILTISVGTSDEIQSGKRYVFRHMVSTSTVTESLVPEIQRRALTKIAAVATIQDGMLAFQQSFKERLGDKVVFATEVLPAERDLNHVVTKIIASGADSVYSTLLPPQGAIFAKQARQLGFKGQIFGATQVNSRSEIIAGGAAFENLFFVVDGDATLSSFEDRFLHRFKSRPDSFAGNAYDAVMLITRALQSDNPIGTLETLSSFDGALGRYGAAPNHTFAIPAHLRRVVAGSVEPLK